MSYRSRFQRWFVVVCLVNCLSIPWILAGFLGLCFVRFYRFFTSIEHGDNDFATVGYFTFGAVVFLAMTVCVGASAQVTTPTIRRIRTMLGTRTPKAAASEAID